MGPARAARRFRNSRGFRQFTAALQLVAPAHIARLQTNLQFAPSQQRDINRTKEHTMKSITFHGILSRTERARSRRRCHHHESCHHHRYRRCLPGRSAD